MLPYAIIGSSHGPSAIDFICQIILTLKSNGYTQRLTHDMWSRAANDTLFTLPCRRTLKATLHLIPHLITSYIDAIYKI